MEVIIQPRAWYRYHRKPEIVEVNGDRTRVLVRFIGRNMYGLTFVGTCLYATMDDTWHTFTIKPDRSGDIATALAWLKKRGWKDWG